MSTHPARALDESAPRSLIFLVEDDPAVTKVVLNALNEFGFTAQGFPTGAAVLRRMQTEKPDLCIVDLGLPDMDGIDLVRRITAHCSAGVLILTGRGHTADRVMGLELGGDDYVTKPFESRELVARVRSILRRRAVAAGATGAQQRRSWAGVSIARPTSCALPMATSTSSARRRRRCCAASLNGRTRFSRASN